MTELDRIEARELQLLRLEVEQESFGAYVRRVSPRYWPPPDHLAPLYRVCEATRHRQVFARVSMPPRHGKTETLSHLLSWWPGVNPAVLNFYVTYGEGLRNATMRRTMRLGAHSGITFARDVKNLQEWHVDRYDGGIMASTVGGEITGRGCNGGVVVADDLVKGRKSVESKLQRDAVWDYFRDDMCSRLQFGASVIVVGTRWHEDDPLGRLYKDSLGFDWEDVVLPAVHDGNYVAVDERVHPGPVPLWPEGGYDLPWARRTRARGEYGWWSLYQQEPRPKGVRLFGEPARFAMPRRGSAEWARWWQEFARGKRFVIGCDCAGTMKTYSNWSSYVVMAVAGWADRTEAWILEVWRDQLSTDRVAEVFLRAQRSWGMFLAVEVNGVGRGVADQIRNPRAVPDMLRKVSNSLRMTEVNRTRDKYTESQPFSAAWNADRVYVPLAPEWDADAYIEEHKAFTGIEDPEDDRVDAGVNGFNRLWKEAPLGSQYGSYAAAEF